jgi:5-methylcytosine-specific restriction endonuclease McrA
MIRKRRSKPRPGRLEGAEYENLRRACFNRANGRCEECGCFLLYRKRWELDPIGYEMAHIQGKRMHGDNPGNVRALCVVCHRTEHSYGKSGIKPVPAKVSA